MLGTFTYHNPTKIYFGPNALEGLVDELTKYGPNVVLVYGGGSIKKNGVYDQVIAILNATGKNVTEIAGVYAEPLPSRSFARALPWRRRPAPI